MPKTWCFFALLLAVCAVPGFSQASPNLAGDYAGMLGSMHVKLHVIAGSDGSLSATVDLPDQHMFASQCADLQLNGNRSSIYDTMYAPAPVDSSFPSAPSIKCPCAPPRIRRICCTATTAKGSPPLNETLPETTRPQASTGINNRILPEQPIILRKPSKPLISKT